MESFKLITEERETLFYKKYQYRASFRCSGISYTRMAKSYIEFERSYNSRFHKASTLTAGQKKTIKQFIDWKNDIISKKLEVSFRLEGWTASIYSNDLELLETLTNFVRDFKLTEVKLLNAPAGTKYFVRQPKHTHRAYLNNLRIPIGDFSSLKEMLNRYENSLFPSKTLNRWLNGRFINRSLSTVFLYGSHYIEFDDPAMLTILHLTFPDIIGKSYKLEKRPDQ